MKRWSSNELRERFLSFFETKDHKRLPGASLVPHNDPTLLLTGAGMVPFKPYFLGREEPQYKRVTTCQRCLRTPDVENVGKTDRHGTFFEMLGNFSFGDYFKRQAIEWAWQFVQAELELPVERLWISTYADDDEAFGIWHREIGIPAGRIVHLGRKDNFWEIGVGPCGPCSEIYYDKGPEHGCGRPDCRPGCDCDRYLEFWNLVFIQYHQDEAGKLTPLERTGIDTGMGLERVASIIQGVDSIFEIDLIRPVIDRLCELGGVHYGRDKDTDVSLRVITEHARGITFMVNDGILPGKDGRGYVLRRLLRRSTRHGRLLDLPDGFMEDIIRLVVELMEAGYPELAENVDYITKVVNAENERFARTLDQGMDILDDVIRNAKQEGLDKLAGEDVFRLYDTYGFPLDLTKEIAAGYGLQVDEDGFQKQMLNQRSTARRARKETGYLGTGEDAVYADLVESVECNFVGYDKLQSPARVLAILDDGETVEQARCGQEVGIILDTSPFYPEGGGQVSDTGTISGSKGQARVSRCFRPNSQLIVHRVEISSGVLTVGDEVVASVYDYDRRDTARNHTSTHLLHAALQDVLGEHATQAGSLVAPDRLRFDFRHLEAVSAEELVAVEDMVNARIMENLPVTAKTTSFQEAKAEGAKALFDEKYGDEVRVVSIGDYSKELCGGTHVGSTGEIGLFKILSEGSVSAGIRRIEAVTGYTALSYLRDRETLLKNISARLDTAPDEVMQRIDQVLDQQKELQKQVNELQKQIASDRLDDIIQQAERIDGSYLCVGSLEDTDIDTLRAMGDRLRDKLGSAVVILGSSRESKVLFVAMATKDLAPGRVHSGDIVKKAASITGGGGGGRPDMAQAGGRNPEKLEEALLKAKQAAREQLQRV